MDKNKSLFSEFAPVSAKQWKQKIQFDLKGADYNEALLFESLEGITVKPFYNSEDVENKVNYTLPENHLWSIAQQVYSGNHELANKKALDVLQRGAESLIFHVPEASVDFAQLLKDLNLNATRIHFQFDFLEPERLQALFGLINSKSAGIHLNLDIIGNLAKTGNWYHNKSKDHQIVDEILQMVKKQDAVSVISVDMARYQNAGANIVQQLAYGLSQANEYLNHGPEMVSHFNKKSITFKVAVGGNYFFEIAKLRALRWLWKSLAHEYQFEVEPHIVATPSLRNKTIYDYNVNMLRTNSECMAAVLGGANTVCNLAYDAVYHKDNEFGERIARNQLLLLKHESYFDEAVHAANGTYFIEAITKQIAVEALALFKQLEAGGGFLNQLQNGTIQRKIKESAQKEQALFDAGGQVSIGTNAFQNNEDSMKCNLEIYPFVKTDKRKTEIEPVIQKRLAEAIEIERLKAEQTQTM